MQRAVHAGASGVRLRAGRLRGGGRRALRARQRAQPAGRHRARRAPRARRLRARARRDPSRYAPHRTTPTRHPRSLTRVLMFAALQWLVLIFEQYFIAVHIQERERRSER